MFNLFTLPLGATSAAANLSAVIF